MGRGVGVAALAIVCISGVAGAAQVAPAARGPPSNLGELSIGELMDLEVTSVSKTESMLSRAAAAVFVITNDDIRRSGATTLADALRLAPGLDVARLNASSWAISSRGFNCQFADKLLVLIDGRSVYTPLFAGVWWDAQDVLLEDVDRIEVIRGPAGTLWGSNAVNGVINVITKRADETQGGLVIGGGGSEELGFGAVRYGGAIGERFAWRASAKYALRDDAVLASGQDANDGWQSGAAGVRADWKPRDDDHLTFQGDFVRGRLGERIERLIPAAPFAVQSEAPFQTYSGNVLTRWTRTFDAERELRLQVYYDGYRRSIEGLYGETRHLGDVEAQYGLRAGRHGLVFGLGYRATGDRIDNSLSISFVPDHRVLQFFGVLAQDEIALLDDRVRLTVGAKLEHNSFTGFEVQPNVRVAFLPNERHTLWGAVSRAVQLPSRSTSDDTLAAQLVPGAPVIGARLPNPDLPAQVLLAYEVGYRGRPLKQLFADVTTFVHVYDGLRTFEPITPPPAPFAAATLRGSLLNATTTGAELAATWAGVDWWQVSGAYTWLWADYSLDEESRDTSSVARAGDSPRHQFSLRGTANPTDQIEFSAGVRFVDRLPNLQISTYAVADARLAWRPWEALELAVVGQNLFQAQHAEFGPTLVPLQATQVQQGVYGKATWTF